MREHLRDGTTSPSSPAGPIFWTGEDERIVALQREFGDQLDVVYTRTTGRSASRGS
jgi:hypothetical protein